MRSMPACLALVVVFALCLSPALAVPPLQVKVDFNSNANFKTSDGTQRFATPANLTPAQKAAIIAKAQAKFDDLLGPGQVVVSEGTGGDMQMIVSGTVDSKRYGNVGQAGRPGVVFGGSFEGNPAFTTDTALTNAIGETLAHEIAHKLGVPHTTGSDLMSNAVSPSVRALDNRAFNSVDRDIILKNLTNGSNGPRLPGLTQPPSAFAEAAPTGTEGPGGYAPQMLGDDPISNEPSFDASISYTGPTGSQFGYMSTSDEFVFQVDMDMLDPGMTFFYDRPYDFAIRLDGGAIVSVTDLLHSYELLTPNPYVTDRVVFQTLNETFSTPQGLATVSMTVLDPSYGGGFVAMAIPEPATLAIVGVGGLTLLRRRLSVVR
ncbi:MAG: PEP-CTERM sorting domain-containing protein [Planctomycetes bacterium]|nr:PEP-CTERM sorting domain-containing protein [Planctomycetota bacterium]